METSVESTESPKGVFYCPCNRLYNQDLGCIPNRNLLGDLRLSAANHPDNTNYNQLQSYLQSPGVVVAELKLSEVLSEVLKGFSRAQGSDASRRRPHTSPYEVDVNE